MPVLYLDVLAAINLTIDYLLLCATARLSGIYARRRWLLLGALLGAAYALGSVLLPLTGVLRALLFAPIGLGMVRIAFGARQPAQLVRLALLFFLTSLGCAGATLLFGELTGAVLLQNGVYYFTAPLRVVFAAGAISYALTGLLFRGGAKHGAIQRDTLLLTISAFQKTGRFSVLIDSGNDLTDPITGLPVVSLERHAVSQLFPREMLFIVSSLRADNTATLLPQIPARYRNRFRLLPYRTLGMGSGLLLAFRPDFVRKANGTLYPCLIAISPAPLTNGAYEGLIGI